MKSSHWIVPITLALSACAPGPGNGQIQFAPLSRSGAEIVGTRISAKLYMPPGPGPFPGVVLLHHCGGIDTDLREWGQRLADMAYATITPDNFSPRGVLSSCATGAISPAQRVGDAYAAANYVRALPQVRKDRIGVMGFSHGGGTIAALASEAPFTTPFRAAVAYYPNCGRTATTAGPPTLVLIGEKDDWTPAPACQAWAARVNDPAKLDVVVYPGAYHKFDGTHSRDVRGVGGVWHHIQPDPAAAGDARNRTDAFLAKWLR